MHPSTRNTDQLPGTNKRLHAQMFIGALAIGLSSAPITKLIAQSVDGAFDGVEAPAPASDEVREAELDDLTAQIGAELRCPICRQQSVAESSSRIAREMQGVIREMLMDEKTPEEIEAYFVQSYGEWILLRPKVQGLNSILYVLPFLALVLALVLIGAKIGAGGTTGIHESSLTVSAPDTGSTLSARDREWLDKVRSES